MASDLYHSCGVVTMASTVFLCLISKSISHQKSTTGTSSEVCTRLITLSATHVKLYNPLLCNTHHTYIIMYIVSFKCIVSYIISSFVSFFVSFIISFTWMIYRISQHISLDIHVYQAMHVWHPTKRLKGPLNQTVRQELFGYYKYKMWWVTVNVLDHTLQLHYTIKEHGPIYVWCILFCLHYVLYNTQNRLSMCTTMQTVSHFAIWEEKWIGSQPINCYS